MAECLSLCQLFYVRFGDALLPGILVKNRRAVLPAEIRALPVQLRRIVGYAKEHFKKLSVGDLGWIECDLNRFGVSRSALAHNFVVRSRGVSPGVSGDYFLDT